MGQKGDSNQKADKEDAPFVKLGKYAAIGLEFNGTLLGGVFLGYLLDLYFNSSPWLVIIVGLSAVVGAFVRLVHWLRRFSGSGN